jgi:hypothetical protein
MQCTYLGMSLLKSSEKAHTWIFGDQSTKKKKKKKKKKKDPGRVGESWRDLKRSESSRDRVQTEKRTYLQTGKRCDDEEEVVEEEEEEKEEEEEEEAAADDITRKRAFATGKGRRMHTSLRCASVVVRGECVCGASLACVEEA